MGSSPRPRECPPSRVSAGTSPDQLLFGVQHIQDLLGVILLRRCEDEDLGRADEGSCASCPSPPHPGAAPPAWLHADPPGNFGGLRVPRRSWKGSRGSAARGDAAARGPAREQRPQAAPAPKTRHPAVPPRGAQGTPATPSPGIPSPGVQGEDAGPNPTAPPRPPPRHKDAHLVGIALEGGGEGGHGTRQPSGEHRGADQGPLLGGAGISIRPSPSIVPPTPNPPQLTSSRTRVCSGVLRVLRGPGVGGAGSGLARGKQILGAAGGAVETPPPKKKKHTHRLGTAGSWHSSTGSPEK